MQRGSKMDQFIMISDVLRETKNFVSEAEDFIVDHNRSYGYGCKCSLASNVKIYDWPDDDILEDKIKDLNTDEKEIVRQAISEYTSEYAENGILSLWQDYLEQQAEQLEEFTDGDMNDLKYYRDRLHKTPNRKNWRFYRRACIEEDMKQCCQDAGFAGRSGGWYMFGHSNALQLDEIQNILSLVLSPEGKICEFDYEEMQYQTDNLWGFVRDGKEALKAFQHVSNFIARCKKNLVKWFVENEIQYQINDALAAYFAEKSTNKKLNQN